MAAPDAVGQLAGGLRVHKERLSLSCNGFQVAVTDALHHCLLSYEDSSHVLRNLLSLRLHPVYPHAYRVRCERAISPVCHAHERGGHLHVSVATLMGHLDVRLWYAHDRVNHDIHLCELLVGGLTNWHAEP
eukprot:gene6828-biopygen4641